MDERLPQADRRPFDGAPSRPPGGLLRAAWAVALCVVAALAPVRAAAQEVEILLPERECQVKYALLYSFGLLTAWPAQAFDPPDTGPFVIGVLGAKPFPEYLNRIAETKKVQGRQIVIRRYKTPEEIARCQILYFTSAVPLEVEQSVLQRLADQPVLTVNERPEAAGASATIQFLIEQGAVKFTLNTNSAKAHQLQFDPRLLKLAKRSTSESPK